MLSFCRRNCLFLNIVVKAFNHEFVTLSALVYVITIILTSGFSLTFIIFKENFLACDSDFSLFKNSYNHINSCVL